MSLTDSAFAVSGQGQPQVRAGSRRALYLCLAAFLVAAFAIRLGMMLAVPGMHRPDEVYQNLEPAHRLWSGWGVVTWEWRDGIRSWLFPGLLAALMALAGPLGLGPEGYLPLIAGTLAFVSLGVVATGMVLGWRQSGVAGAVICGVLCSFWPELVYYAPRTLGEVQGGNLLVIAAGLATLMLERPGTGLAPERPGTVRQGWVWGVAIGVLLGLVVVLRFQLAPAALLVAGWAGRRDVREGWRPLVVGAAVPLLLLGITDWVTWGSPFQSIWKNLQVNLLEHRSLAYGKQSPLWFAGQFVQLWGAALLPVAVFFVIGAPRAKLMAATAIVVVLSHSLVGHKEISFIYAALPAGMIVAGIGTARVVTALPGLLRPRWTPAATAAVAAILWMMVAVLTGGGGLRPMWSHGSDMLRLWVSLRERPDLCGVGLYGAGFRWQWTGGYTYLNRKVPIYFLETPAAFAEAQPGANYMLTNAATDDPVLHDYATLACAGGTCLVRRDGGCDSVAPQDRIDAVLARKGW
jgi:GPI mannosyltransferase 3